MFPKLGAEAVEDIDVVDSIGVDKGEMNRRGVIEKVLGADDVGIGATVAYRHDSLARYQLADLLLFNVLPIPDLCPMPWVVQMSVYEALTATRLEMLTIVAETRYEALTTGAV